jgi:Tfp pilus assembly PilM family ATPase
MLFFRRGQLTGIGVDVGARAIKAAQARVTSKGLVVTAMTSVERPGGKGLGREEAALLREVLRRKGFVGNRVARGGPAGAMHIESLELPPGGAASEAVKKIAGVELGRISKMKAGSFEHAVWELPALSRGGTATQVMGVALGHKETEAVIVPLVEAGLDVAAVCPMPNAINALAGQVAEQMAGVAGGEETVHAVVEVGWTATRFVIGNAGRVLYYRTLQDVGVAQMKAGLIGAAGAELEEEVAEHVIREVGLSAEGAGSVRTRRVFEQAVEAIGHELKLTHAYIGHRYQQLSLGGLFVTGGGAGVPGLAAALAEMAGQEAVVLSPGSAEGKGESSQMGWAGMTPALAAAVYAEEAWL